MDPIDDLGLFWHPGKPDRQLSGRLTFDPASNIRLSLVGDFGEPRNRGDETDLRLHGWIGTQPVTLDRGFALGSSMPSRGVSHTTYAANGLFLGHHIDENPAKFSTLYLEISDLDNWVGLKGAEETFNWDSTESQPLYSFSYTPAAPPVATFDRGTIELKTMWKQGSPQPHTIGFRTWPAFRLAYNEPQAFGTIMQDASQIVALVAICIDGVASIDKLVVSRDDIRETMLDGKTDGGPRMIEYRAPSVNYIPPAERKPREWHRMLLTFEQLGGIARVAKWLDIVPGFQYALNSMMSINCQRRLFIGNRFLNVTNSAESFHRAMIGGGQLPTDEFDEVVRAAITATAEVHRDWLAGRLEHANDPTLRKRLSDLARTGGAAVRPLIGNGRNWAFAISKTRNLLTHLGEGHFSGSELRYLSDSVYAVTRACMLSQVGVPMTTLESVADSPNMIWYRNELHEAIAHVRASDTARSGQSALHGETST